MNRRNVLHLIGYTPASLLIPNQTSENTLVHDLADRWRKSKEYTLAVLEAMPEAHLEYRPTADQLTFAQHFIHLSFFNNFFLGFMADPVGFTEFERIFTADYLIPRPDDLPLFEPAHLRKTEESAQSRVRDYVAQTFDFGIETLTNSEDQTLYEGKNKLKPAFLADHSHLDLILRSEVHTAHHRAQAVVYLRLKEITPPGFGI